MCCRQAVLLALMLVVMYAATEARYLPTRSQDDRLDRLRELLRDLLESEVEKTNVNNNSYDRRMLYKRQVPMITTEQQQAPLVSAQQ
ncbi:uncharacterized protein LOC110837415 [Zootermopsis nevadensis]|uniref:Proctolin n=1 Tax=Zootermopsis nevadensis TaxID=136037 RepID=A0A067QP08_ZOONE|nr:uncharacterized protein LOC110837415 [Zootermopsis nevadensis]KDR11073.1 hypothetical protein L798_14658 [Zootermopsis nevadensis]